jgi:hypothetical protein
VIERRTKKRFPVVVTARYLLPDRETEPIAGTGQTVNISSSGMFLHIEHVVTIGERIEIAMDLLGLGEASIGVELTAFGHVVRLEPDSAAIHFERHELRRRFSSIR